MFLRALDEDCQIICILEYCSVVYSNWLWKVIDVEVEEERRYCRALRYSCCRCERCGCFTVVADPVFPVYDEVA